jgi:hypothetical protein
VCVIRDVDLGIQISAARIYPLVWREASMIWLRVRYGSTSCENYKLIVVQSATVVAKHAVTTVEVVIESNKYEIIDPNLSIRRKITRCPLTRSTPGLILTRYIGTNVFGEAFLNV